jgi:hypothetical protein
VLAEELLMVLPNPFLAVAALFRVARAYWRSDPFFASGRLVAKRRKICNGCFHRDPGSDQCRLCTCFLGLKTGLTTEKCPIDRW